MRYISPGKFCLLPLIYCLNFCFIQSLKAQEYLKQFERKMTPSPSISSLNTYGGIDVRKNTGGISKSIDLFEIQEGDISYRPAIDYFSTGIKVNEWGSRTGIGWTENVTAMISRTVRGVPDERADTRIGDGQFEFGSMEYPDFSQESYDKVKVLAVNNGTVDGEYDVFSFSIWGLSGSFIIRNGQAVQLNHTDSIRITILQNSPTYKFLITNAKGYKYYFDTEIEYTGYNNENSCDQDNVQLQDVATGWFLNKIVSPTGNELLFHYEPVTYSYLYDYSEYYLYFWDPLYPCSSSPPPNEHYACVRRKTTTTKYLTGVTGLNFVLNFSYSDREDLYYEKLLQEITLYANNNLLRRIVFSYDKIVAGSIFESQLESILDGDPWENNALKTRYFLKSLQISGNSGIPVQHFLFDYIEPDKLPHRFSFSQDLFGCFNGQQNSGFVPKEALEGWSESLATGASFANRHANIKGMAGLLNRIIYPTGGKDSIIYEQNSYKATVTHIEPGVLEDNLMSYSTYEEFVSDPLDMPFTQSVKITLQCFNPSENLPPDDEGEYYYAEVELWNKTDNVRVNFPNGSSQGAYNVRLKLSESYSTGSYNIPVDFDSNKAYEFRCKIGGYLTTLHYKIDYAVDYTHTQVDTAFVGFRVKSVLTKPLTGSVITKLYDYNLFKKSGSQLVFTDSTSLIRNTYLGYHTLGLFFCSDGAQREWTPSGRHKLASNSNYDNNIYGGLPYAYSTVTEFLDSVKTSFNASQYNVTPNMRAGRVLQDVLQELVLINPTLNNMAWDHGLEIKRYHGGVNDNKYSIDKEYNWHYSEVQNVYFNYSAYGILDRLGVFESPRSNLRAYIVKSYETFCNWYKLDSLKEIDYTSDNHILSSLTRYRYNSGDKQLEEEELKSSTGDVLLRQIYRPYKMVSLELDPNGIYQEMINEYILSPAIQVISKTNQVQTNLIRTNYYQPFNGLYVPQSIQTQETTNDPIVTRLVYLRHDVRGNVLSLSKDGGAALNYLWAYKGQYPVAKILNADYAAIENIMGTAAIASFCNTNPVKTDIDSFIAPLKSAMPGSQITTYSYRPLTGLTSMTDPKGNTAYFNYDSFQRLENVYDQDGNIIRNYQYNFKQP